MQGKAKQWEKTVGLHDALKGLDGRQQPFKAGGRRDAEEGWEGISLHRDTDTVKVGQNLNTTVTTHSLGFFHEEAYSEKHYFAK